MAAHGGTPTAAATTPLVWAARLLCVAFAYYFTARLGLLIPYVGTHVSLVWLPTGIAMAAYLRWSGLVSAGVFAAALAVNVQIGGPVWMGLGIAAGNTLGPWLSARVLRRFGFDISMTRRFDLAVFMLAVALGMLATASNGTAWLHIAGLLPAVQWPSAWMTWWVGDAVGALLAGVPLLTLTAASAREAFAGRNGFVNLLLLAGVLLCSLLGFSSSTPEALLFPLLALPLFLTVVLAMRAGVFAASLSVLLMSAAAAWGTARGVGPFAGPDAHAGLLALWSYITAQACTSVLICGLAAELLSTRRQQATLFEHANEGILLLLPDGHIDAINPAACKMLGMQPAAARHKPLRELPHGNGAVLAAWLTSAGHEGSPASMHRVGLTGPGGMHVQAEVQKAEHRNARGQRLTQLMLRDVTARHDAEARLATSEQRLRLVTDNMPALIAHYDREHRFLFANKTYADWFGIAPESLIGKRFDEAFGAASYAARREVMDDALRSRQSRYLERESERNGARRHLRTIYVPDVSSDGEVIGLFELTMDVSQLKAVEAQLRTLSHRDHLTGLPNRLHFEAHLQAALARNREAQGMMALAYVDVDRFKSVNDNLGHAAGDAVLKEFARRLCGAVRASDTVARLGGDEFVVVFDRLRTQAEAELVAGKIVEAMRQPIALVEGEVTATASVGIAVLDGDTDTADAQALMACADEALYQAKRGGRDAFRVKALQRAEEAQGHAGGPAA